MAFIAAAKTWAAWEQYKAGRKHAETTHLVGEHAMVQATMVEAQGALDSARFKQMVDRTLGDVKAGFGASGVQMSGSAIDAYMDVAANEELDGMMVEYQTKVEAFTLRQQAQISFGEASAQKQQARANFIGSFAGSMGGMM